MDDTEISIMNNTLYDDMIYNDTIYNDTIYNDTIYNLTNSEVPREHNGILTVYIIIAIMCFIPFCCILKVIWECIYLNIAKHKEYIIKKNLKKNNIKTCIKNSIFKINYDNLNDNNCSICLDKLEKNIGMLECKHTFHKNCIKPWIENNLKIYGISTCPICRQTISILDNSKDVKSDSYTYSYSSDESDYYEEY